MATLTHWNHRFVPESPLAFFWGELQNNLSNEKQLLGSSQCSAFFFFGVVKRMFRSHEISARGTNVSGTDNEIMSKMVFEPCQAEKKRWRICVCMHAKINHFRVCHLMMWKLGCKNFVKRVHFFFSMTIAIVCMYSMCAYKPICSFHTFQVDGNFIWVSKHNVLKWTVKICYLYVYILEKQIVLWVVLENSDGNWILHETNHDHDCKSCN